MDFREINHKIFFDSSKVKNDSRASRHRTSGEQTGPCLSMMPRTGPAL